MVRQVEGSNPFGHPSLKPSWLNWIEHWISAPGVTGSIPVEGTMNYFNKIYKLLWVFLIFLIMYLSFQRNIKIDGNHQEVVSAFSSSPTLSIVTIITDGRYRCESKNQKSTRKYIYLCIHS